MTEAVENSAAADEEAGRAAASDEPESGGKAKCKPLEALFFMFWFIVGFMPIINISAAFFLIKEIKICGRDIKLGGCSLRDLYKTCLKALFAGMLFSIIGIIFAVPCYIYEKLTDRKKSD